MAAEGLYWNELSGVVAAVERLDWEESRPELDESKGESVLVLIDVVPVPLEDLLATDRPWCGIGWMSGR